MQVVWSASRFVLDPEPNGGCGTACDSDKGRCLYGEGNSNNESTPKLTQKDSVDIINAKRSPAVLGTL
jgi:hypothetical protein